MDHFANRVFISYRRDDAAGYAGRLEEALERRLGRGSAFRDVLDIAPGEDFVQAIRERLRGARVVLVVIGPRWSGADETGRRRIDDEKDFVHLEVAVALESGAKLVPLLLPGAEMPTEASLPPSLQALARHNALSLDDAHWDADIAKLADSIGLPKRRVRWPLPVAALAVLVLLAGWIVMRPKAPLATAPVTDATERLVGVWTASVLYPWGVGYSEHFEFKREAGLLSGTASFLATPRLIENLRMDSVTLHFETRTATALGDEKREETHSYSAELRGQPPDEVLAFRMLSRGGFSNEQPLVFEARRLQPGDSARARRLPAPPRP